VTDYETDFEVIDEYETDFEIIEDTPQQEVQPPAQAPTMLDEVGAYGRAALTKPMMGGSFADEILAVPATLGTSAYRAVTGDKIDFAGDYAKNLNNIQSQFGEDREIAPIATFAGDLAGDVRTGFGATKLAAKAAPSSAVAKVTKYARQNPKRTAAGIGGVSGGVYGFGASDGTVEERLEAGLYSGIGGLALGPVAARGGEVVGDVLRNSNLLTRAKNVLNKTPVKTDRALQDIADEASQLTIKDAPAAEARAINKIRKAIKKDFPNTHDEVFQSWLNGDQALIESYGSRARTLGQGAAQYKSGKAVAQDYFEDAVAEAPENMKAAIAKNISGVENYYKTVDDIMEAGSARAGKYYDEAYNDAVQNTEIFKVPEIQEAIEKAYKKYPSKLKDHGPESIKVLDYAKRVLDDDISKAMRAGEKGFAKDRIGIKETLVNAMDEASPSYATARTKAGDYLKVSNSMEAGKQFMKLDPEEIVKAMKNSTEEEKIAFKIGVGKQLRDKINTKIDGSNPYNSIFGSKTQRERLSKILSPEEFKNLEKSLKAEKRIFDMRNEILGGSPTAGKQQAALEIAGGGAEMAQIANGGVNAMPKNTMIAGIRKMFDGLSDDTAEQISKILYETDPSEKLRLFTELSSKVSKSQYKEAQKAYFTMEKALSSGRTAGALSGGSASNETQEFLLD